MTIQHKSLRDEVLFVIGRASAPLNSGEIYERVELADEMKQVSNALFQLHAAGKLQRIEGEGRVRYALASGVSAPAPAGNAGRKRAPVTTDVPPTDASGLLTVGYGVAPESTPPALDIPPPGDLPRTAAEDEAVAKALDLVEKRAEPVARSPESERGAASLADAMIARLKRDLGPLLRPTLSADVDVTTAPAAITVTVQRVEIHISIGVSA